MQLTVMNFSAVRIILHLMFTHLDAFLRSALSISDFAILFILARMHLLNWTLLFSFNCKILFSIPYNFPKQFPFPLDFSGFFSIKKQFYGL